MNDGAQNTKNGFVGQVLLAMPAMTDPRFERSVIYICAHNEDGAMGIVINKTLNSIDFRDLLEELDIPTDPTTRNITVHFGGPVETSVVLSCIPSTTNTPNSWSLRAGRLSALSISCATSRRGAGQNIPFLHWDMRAGDPGNSKLNFKKMPGCPFRRTRRFFLMSQMTINGKGRSTVSALICRFSPVVRDAHRRSQTSLARLRSIKA